MSIFNSVYSHSEHYTHLPGQYQATSANRRLSAGYKPQSTPSPLRFLHFSAISATFHYGRLCRAVKTDRQHLAEGPSNFDT